ncbi:helix-turn-helix transcriptional regulator [Stenotrophomonas sp. PS02300]|uniref:helix-turn-helix transcriptional regulator n=1 Tax=Stenotrophomonas sp. PS02300 TaxID=2991426 RepID=UPI00249BB658|nr:helix-turn-helix transcriptional regulator [Stenotrophomonas sp. PS02300]
MAKRIPPVHLRHARQIEALGQRLRVARVARGMTQANLAERVGVDRTTIGKLESGEPGTSLATVLRVLSALGMGGDIDGLAAADTVGAQLATRQLRRPSPRTLDTHRQPKAEGNPIDHGGAGSIEPTPDRYALRATRRPDPIVLPPVDGRQQRTRKR